VRPKVAKDGKAFFLSLSCELCGLFNYTNQHVHIFFFTFIVPCIIVIV